LDELPRAVRVRGRDGYPQRLGRVFAGDERRPLVLDRIEEIFELSSQRLFLPDVDFLSVVFQRDLVEVERVQGPEGARADRDRLLRVVDLDEVLETGEGELAHFHRGEPVHLDEPMDAVLEPQQDVRVVLEGRVDLTSSEGEDALHRRADEVADDVDLVDAEVHHNADVPDAAGERTHAARRRGHQVAVLTLLELALHDRDRRIVSLDVAHRERDARALRGVGDPMRVRDLGVHARVVLAHRADPDDPDAHRRRHKSAKETSGYKRAARVRPVSKASYPFVSSVAMFGGPMAVDPVCGKPVNPHNAYWMIWYKGTPYYFCGEDCQLKFDHKPEHYRQLALDRRQNEAVY